MSASRSRQKRKLEPISIEELAGTTGMSGFCSFLTRDISVPVPVLDRIESSAPVSEAPEPAPVESSAPVIAAVEPPAPVPAALDSGYGTPVPDIGALEPPALEPPAIELPAFASSLDESSAPEAGAPDFRYPRRPRIREAITVQDGHSLAEQAVYNAMFGAGKSYQGDARILTIGLRTLAELSRMAYSNCKANVRSLIAKLAIDELPGFSYTDGRTYVIHGYRDILQRRRAAGLTHVLRTRGVAFVDPQSGAPKTSAPDSRPIPNLESSAPDSTAPEAVLDALRQRVPEADAATAAALWRRCREVEPAAAPADVAHFIHVKAGKSGVPTPLGFLLAAVPRCFQGETWRQYRDLRRAEDLAARDRALAAEILRNPDADDEQREWARSVLE
jgi:hypothetical protein